MLFPRRTSVSFKVLVSVLALCAAICWGGEKQSEPTRTWDLREFGYSSEQADYSVAEFLSDNLLLVAINQRAVSSPHPLVEDTPEATLVLFDMSNGATLGKARTPMSKSNYSIAPVLGSQFLMLTSSEVRLCSIDLQCDRSVPTKGPLWVSPDRARAVVGGNLGTPQVVLDSRTLAPIVDADHNSPNIPAKPGASYGRDGSFAESILSADGQRLMKVKVKQTGWNKLTNPLSGFGDRPYNSQRIVVYEKRSGAELFAIHWDPRKLGTSLTTLPALSPTGHEVARLRRGVVEVFDVP